MDKKKYNKKLGKICPECEGLLNLVSRKIKTNGIEYVEQYIECDCGYSEKFKVSNKNNKEEFSKW